MPEIPIGPGEQLVKLGEGMQNLGVQLTQFRTQEEDVTKAAEYAQLTQFQLYANDITNRFIAGLDSNPDPQQYSTAWDNIAKEIEDNIPIIATLPEAQLQVTRWWANLKDASQEKVFEKARSRFVANTENNQSLLFSDLIRQGNEEQARQSIESALAAGVISKDTADRQRAQLPDARYNYVKSFFMKMPYDEAIDKIANPEFTKKMGLDEAQREKLDKDLKFQRTTANEVAQRKLAEAQTKNFNDFIQDSLGRGTDETGRPVPTLSRDKAVWYSMNVNAQDRAAVLNYIAAVDKQAEQDFEARQKFTQDTVYDKYGLSISIWNGAGKPPWELEDISQLFNEKKISLEERDKLFNLYNQIMDDIKNGRRGRLADDPVQVAAMTQLVYDFTIDDTERTTRSYSYLGNGVSPATWAKLFNDITEFRQDWADYLKLNVYPFFTNSIALIPTEKDDERKAMVQQQAAVIEQMKEAFRTHTGDKPGDVEYWDKTLASTMNPLVQARIIDGIKTITGGAVKTGNIAGIGNWSKEDILSVTRDLDFDTVKSDVLTRSDLGTNKELIRKKEEGVMKGVGVVPTDAVWSPSEYRYYYYTGGRLPADGKDAAEALMEKGYMAKFVLVNGKPVRKIYRFNSATGEWDIEVKK
jgi:hypothetical protein